jgi:hypothetical protein
MPPNRNVAEALSGQGPVNGLPPSTRNYFGHGETVTPPVLPQPKALANIGELTAEHRATLQAIWRGEQPLTALPESVRQQLAGLYSRVASENPAGFAQAAFNEARAKFLLGQGPNPGPSVNDCATRMGIPKFKR